MNEDQKVCLCGCHQWGDDDAVGCTACQEAERDLYYLSKDRSGRSIIEGCAAMLERWMGKR